MPDINAKNKILDTVAKNSVDRDDLATEKTPAYRRRFEQLLLDPGQRDPKLWERLFTKSSVDPAKWAATKFSELIAVPLSQRTENWKRILTVFVSSARRQAELELITIPALEMASRQAKDVNAQARKLTKKTAVAAALEGIKSRVDFEQKKRTDGKS